MAGWTAPAPKPKMPVNAGYVLNFKQMRVQVQPIDHKLETPQGSTLKPGVTGAANGQISGIDAGILEVAITYDPIRRQWIVTASLPLQIQIHPRYQVRIGAYA